MNQLKYLRELSERYPSISSASTEIINLQAILNLPKGTEHYVSDLHGEYEKFSHIVRNGSGAIKDKIDDQFGNTLTLSQKKNLASVIYYPEQKMDMMEEELEGAELEEWYRLTMIRLITMAKLASSKYTRSKVRKTMEPEFAYIMEELITEHGMQDKEEYFDQIIDTILDIGRVRAFIAALGHLIQKLTIDQLHVIGDIYDRGPGAHRIMDCLMGYHRVDIQWGNHDILWMGAASGHPACIANVVRICARYNNLDTLENGYGINMIPLARFAYDTYRKDPCEVFCVSGEIAKEDVKEVDLNQKMHKAIAVIQFKLEGQLIQKHPDFDMDGRLLLDKINYEEGTVLIDGKEYNLLDHNFPTIDPENPYKLTKEEEYVMDHLVTAFKYCSSLQEHIRFLFAKGSMYLTYNNMVLYHGCVPLNHDGSFREVSIKGKKYAGKKLYDILEHYVRLGYFGKKGEENHRFGKDIMWFIWSNENSPVYGKDKMATFERYFLDEKELKIETKDDYYKLIEQEDVLVQILEEFGADGKKGHIVNGHMPVAVKNGESPMRCGGKLFIIDGGFSKAYQQKTGIGGYTLVSNSYGIKLVAHKPFESREYAIRHETDIHSDTVLEKKVLRRKQVGDTDIGKQIREKIEDLKELLVAYQDGEIAERI